MKISSHISTGNRTGILLLGCFQALSDALSGAGYTACSLTASACCNFDHLRSAYAALQSECTAVCTVGYAECIVPALLLAEIYPADALILIDSGTPLPSSDMYKRAVRNLFAVTSPVLLLHETSRTALPASLLSLSQMTRLQAGTNEEIFSAVLSSLA